MRVHTGCIPSNPDFRDNLYCSLNLQLPSSFAYEGASLYDQLDKSICVPCSIRLIHDYHRKRYGEKSKPLDMLRLYKSSSSMGGMVPRDAFNHLLKHVDEKLPKLEYFQRISSEEQICDSLLSNGPAFLVLPVCDPGIEKFWTGDVVQGYHAVVIVGWKEHEFIIQNSYGSSYGENGRALIQYSDIEKLARELWTLRFEINL